jgi:DNA-binding beta-propeller fold protein YncE
MSKFYTIAGMAVVIVSLFVVCALAQQNPRELYLRAQWLDESNQNLTEAIKLYKQFVSQTKDQRALAARAQYRVGVLYERLGRKAEALKAFRALVSQYPDQVELWQRAQAKLAAEARSKANEVVVKRSGPSPDGRYLATFTFPAKPELLLSRPAIDPNGRRLYLVTKQVRMPRSEADSKRTKQQGTPYVHEPSTLIVIDTQTNSIVKTIPLSVYVDDIAFNPANNTLYATAQMNGHVKAIDASAFTETKIAVAGHPTDIAINPIMNKIYVTSQGFSGNDKLFVIDGATNGVTGPFDLDGVAENIVVNSVANRIYATAEPKTRVFNGSDNSVVTDLPGIRVIAADPVHNRLYARELMAGSLQALDGNTHSRIAAFDRVSRVHVVAVDSDANRLYATLAEQNQIAIIDTNTHTEMGRVSFSDQPIHLTLDHTTGLVYVCHRGSAPMLGVLAKSALEIAPEEFFDDFDSPTLGAEWMVVSGQGSYSLTENPGHLRFRIAKPSEPTPRLLLIRQFRGDAWRMEIKAAYSTGKSGGNRTLDFSIGFGAVLGTGTQVSNGVYVTRARDDWNGCCPGKAVQSFYENNVTATISFAPHPADAYIWRITRQGRTVTVEESDDGVEFKLVGTRTFGPQIDGVVQYLSLSFTTHANNDSYADYDYIRLSKRLSN